MNEQTAAYTSARAAYAEIGVDTEAAIKRLSEIPISMHCWQGDDVRGFLSRERELSGGIQTTGNYPGAARTADELRRDLHLAYSLIPGRHRLNLHAIYAETDGTVELPDLNEKHFSAWMDFARAEGIGLDFNPTCFSHPLAENGTLSAIDPAVRDFWIAHCKASRSISEAFGRATGTVSVTNFWFPDGSKDIPIDRDAPRARMREALDCVMAEKKDPACHLDALESKVFGIGAESYTVASHEFSFGYAVSRGIAYTLDAGHFHPTEVISDKLTSVLQFAPELLLHVSRPVRWDSDHVVILDDELRAIAQNLVRSDLLSRTHIGLDYFDASINRVAAWVIGMRNMQKALLIALLEPTELLKQTENAGDCTARLALTEQYKTLPFGAVYNEFCVRMGVPTEGAWLSEVRRYENEVLSQR